MYTVGQRIKIRLKEAGLTQKKLSELTGIPIETIYTITKDQVDPGINKILKIANAVNADLNWLITGKTYNEIIAERESKYGNIKDSIVGNVTAGGNVYVGESEVSYGGKEERRAAYRAANMALIIEHTLRLDPKDREFVLEFVKMLLKKKEEEK